MGLSETIDAVMHNVVSASISLYAICSVNGLLVSFEEFDIVRYPP